MTANKVLLIYKFIYKIDFKKIGGNGALIKIMLNDINSLKLGSGHALNAATDIYFYLANCEVN